MTKVYNENILIKYLYDEADKQEVLAVESVLKRSSRVRREFRHLQNLKASMNTVHKGPKSSTISTILERSAYHKWMWL